MSHTQIAATAAKYWADKLRGTPTPQEQICNAEIETDTIQAAFLSAFMPTDVSPPVDKLKVFERELTSIIAAELEKGPMFLMVDYDACAFLCDAAERAGIKLTTFMLPWKHRMWVHPRDGIQVGEGNAEPLKPLVVGS